MKRIFFTAFFALLFVAAFAIGCASTQPHMAAARDQLVAARSELQVLTSSLNCNTDRESIVVFFDALLAVPVKRA